MPQIPVQSPIKGVNRVVSREGQDPGNCWDALNVLPYDRYGRHRVSQRYGLAKLYSTALGSTQIQGMLPVYNISYAGSFNATHTQPFNLWTHIPTSSTDIGVSTSSNTVKFFSQLPFGTESANADSGPQFNSTVLNYGQGFQLTFNVNWTAGPFSTANLWVYVPSSSTAMTFGGTPRLQSFFTFDGNGGAGVQVMPSTTNLGNYAFLNPTITTPPSTAIPCAITWTEAGNVSASINGSTTNTSISNPALGTINVPRSGEGYHFQFYSQVDGDGPSSTNASLTVSNIVLSYGASTALGGAATYQTLLVAVCQGFVWKGDSAGNMSKAANGQSTALISSTGLVSMAYADGQVFIADGSGTLWNYTIATDTVASTAPVPSPGNITGTVPTNCNLVCNWRGRLVLAGDSSNPQNVYFARPAGTYFNTVTSTLIAIGAGVDWDYSQTDPAAAFASNLATSGKIGQPITALIPFSDDLMKIGCSHSLWMYQGDPADGGSCVKVSDLLGIVGPNAWCVDPAGTLWFVATGGLFSVRPAWEFYRPPEAITTMAVNQFFENLNPSSTRVNLVFDADQHYLHVLMTPLSGAAGTHLTLDARDPQTPAFFPQAFPSTAGPIAACIFMGDANPNNRTIAFGGFDGYIRSWGPTIPLSSTACVDDDGSAINAYVVLGPYQPVPGGAAVLSGVTLNLSEVPAGLSSTQWGLSATIAAGPTAFDVTEGVSGNLHPQPTIAMTMDRRQKTFRQRVRGGFFTLKLANTIDADFFGLESGVLEFMPAGKSRDLR